MRHFIAAILWCSFASGAVAADSEQVPILGAPLAALEQRFAADVIDPRPGVRYASCHSLDPDAGGPVEAFLVATGKFDEFEFFWIATDETGRLVQDVGSVVFGYDDSVWVTALQGGLWIDEAMERTIIPLLSTHPRLAHSAEEIFQRPRGRCRYSPPTDTIDPKPRHRPKIKPEWFASK